MFAPYSSDKSSPLLSNISRQSISTRLQDSEKSYKTDQQIKPILQNPLSYKKEDKEDKKDKKPMNNVIVLADNKNYDREFLKCIGVTTGSPYLCTIHVPTRFYTYQIYGLEEPDEKIFNHVNANAGLIIITTPNTYPKLFSRIKLFADKISHIPILIVIEIKGTREYDEQNKPKLSDLGIGSIISKSNVKYEISTDLNSSQHGYRQGGIGMNNLVWFNSQVIKFDKTKPSNIIPLEQLVSEFVDCKLSIENWNHLNRLRMVYFSLKNFGYEKTIDQTGWLCVNWNKYKNTIGHAHLWNYTLTKFWIDQIFSLMLKEPKMDFATIYSQNSYLSDGNLHKKYYTNEVLFSDKARKEWIEPDL